MQETKTNGVTSAAAETIDKAKDIGRETIDKGYEGARDYASAGLDYAGEVSGGLAEFAHRQPWIALVGAFAFGYFAAHALRKFSS